MKHYVANKLQMAVLYAATILVKLLWPHIIEQYTTVCGHKSFTNVLQHVMH